MSDVPADYRDRLDLRAIIARIDRDRSESLKLQEEREKFIAEQRKLIAEAGKLNRDRWLAPWILATSVVGGIAGAIFSHYWK
jgi:hypothetical protein